MLESGEKVVVKGFPSTESYDRDLKERYVAKSQKRSFTIMKSELGLISTGDTLIRSESLRKIVAIIDNDDGTVTLELKEEIHSKKGSKNDEPDDTHGFG